MDRLCIFGHHEHEMVTIMTETTPQDDVPNSDNDTIRKQDILQVLADLRTLGPDDQFPDIVEGLLPAKTIDI